MVRGKSSPRFSLSKSNSSDGPALISSSCGSSLNKLSVAAGDQDKSSVHVSKKVSALKFAQELEQVGIYSYCFEGSLSQEAFKGWVATNWVREKKLKVVTTRPVGPSAFVTVCETKDCRDRALQSRVAQLRSALVVHYPWKPQVDDPQYSPDEKPTAVEILSFPTCSKDLLSEVFEAIAPILKISSAAKSLTVENPRATLLWDPSKKRPTVVTLAIERDDSDLRACMLQLPVRFLDFLSPAQDTGPQHFHSDSHRTEPPVNRDPSPKANKPQTSSKGSTSPSPQPTNPHGPNFSEVPPAPIIVEVTDSDEVLADQQPSEPQQRNNSEGSSLRAILAARRRERRSSSEDHTRGAKRQISNSSHSTVNTSAKRRRGTPKPDSETHISAERLRFLVSTVTTDYLVLAADAHGRSGGVAILVHKSCNVEEWKAVSHRVITATIVINRVRIPLVNIYSPVEGDLRRTFWGELLASLIKRGYLFLGDWNVVEDPSDSSSKSNWLSRHETVPFLTFKNTFHLHDVRNYEGEHLGPAFTRFQLKDGRPVWSALDRFYLPLSLLGGFHVMTVHHPDFPLSDHLPVSLLLSGSQTLTAKPHRSLFFKVDPQVLGKDEIRSSIPQIWERHRAGSPLDSPEKFFAAWLEVRGVVKEAQYQDSLLLSTLDSKKKQLSLLVSSSRHPDLHEYGHLAEEVRRLEALREHKIRLWTKDKFIAEGESNSAYYLRRFKARCLRGRVHSLRHEDGSIARTQTEIVNEVHNFYSKIYSKPVETEQMLADRRRLIGTLSPVISPAQRMLLSEAPSFLEFSDILKSSPRGKAPGPDGFSYEALSELWATTGHDYTMMMQNCWSSASFPACLKEGIIKLIPKDLRPESLHQWRPIALLNAHYKLLAKVIAIRLALILPLVVPVQQEGFIKGRNVQACLLNVLLTQDLLRKNGKQVGFLMLDLEKAYDRLSQDFLWEVLQQLGFGDSFIAVLQDLSRDATVRVQVNDVLSPDFPIQRGVRQGCPLAPLLFALSSIPFILAVQTAASKGLIKTLKLPSGFSLDVVALADDTAAFLALEESTFAEFFRILDGFQSAWGAKINLRKSKVLILGKYSQPPLWLQQLPIQLMSRHEPTRYLGIPLANSLRPQAVWMQVVAAVSGKVQSLNDKQVSFEGRCALLRFLVQSKLSFAISILLLRNSHAKTLRSLFRSFLWGLSSSGKPKTPLVAWDFLAAPVSHGGLGLWDLQELLVWKPQVLAIPESMSAPAALTLLRKAGVFSAADVDMLRGWAARASNWAECTILLSEEVDGGPTFRQKLQSFVSSAGTFHFSPGEWVLLGSDIASSCNFPVPVGKAYAILVSQHLVARTRELNCKWGLFWTSQQWEGIFRIIWSKGLPNRDSISLWRFLFQAFFTTSKGTLLGHTDITYIKCGCEGESVTHALAMCPNRASFWS
ncbi:hypothetical protein R1sor_026610 [Riccia sorocarpa]|uniref:Reverse transcriptase domain-containing protein n=1 Tax=Riccia sorocarpa TaxID=122646 RepID=A0ABD3GDK1_9MARC